MALCAAVMFAVPLAGVEASFAAPATGAAVTSFPVSSFPRGITVGPDGALWFTNQSSNAGNGSIGRITTAGVVTTFTDPDIMSPGDITAGPDGALWFVDDRTNNVAIGRITTAGVVTRYTDPSIADPQRITAGPDGALWFTNYGTFDQGTPTADKGSIGRITTAGVVTNYRDPSIAYPIGIAAGPDGALWFTNTGGDAAGDKGSIGRITTTGTVTNYTDPTINYPAAITAGPDGNMWFANAALIPPRSAASIGRITTAGVVTNYTDPSINQPSGITAGADGALWFTNGSTDSIGRITTAGTVTSTQAGSPSSQSDRPFAITAGPDGALWFTTSGDSSGGSIGRITTDLTAAAPTSPSVVAQNAAAIVHWTAPANSGSAPTTAYIVTPYLGDAAQTPQVFNTTATTETVTGLTNDQTYQFKIAAENSHGIGAWSAFTLPVTIGPPSPWTIVPSPNPGKPPTGFGSLSSVSCTSARNCFAVGSGAANTQNEPLIERWNGTHWSIAPAPDPTNGGEAVLNGISCINTTHCVAVGGGDAGPLAERWNGTKWSITPITGPTELFSVSCATTTECFAVGIIIGTPVIERWNGTKWSTVASPTGTYYLTGVSCTSTKNCVAVGYNLSGGPSIAEHWNGTRWSTIASPHPSNFFARGLAGVSCTSTTNCFAVGEGETITNQYETFVTQWNGTTWRTVPSPNPSDSADADASLNGISCTNATACVAVGTEFGVTPQPHTTETLIEQWNGSQWSIVGSPNPTSARTLNAVSCTTATNCDAVGSVGLATLVEHS